MQPLFTSLHHTLLLHLLSLPLSLSLSHLLLLSAPLPLLLFLLSLLLSLFTFQFSLSPFICHIYFTLSTGQLFHLSCFRRQMHLLYLNYTHKNALDEARYQLYPDNCSNLSQRPQTAATSNATNALRGRVGRNICLGGVIAGVDPYKIVLAISHVKIVFHEWIVSSLHVQRKLQTHKLPSLPQCLQPQITFVFGTCSQEQFMLLGVFWYSYVNGVLKNIPQTC